MTPWLSKMCVHVSVCFLIYNLQQPFCCLLVKYSSDIPFIRMVFMNVICLGKKSSLNTCLSIFGEYILYLFEGDFVFLL